MAWQSTQALPATGFRTNALPALAGSRVRDIRDILRSSPVQKCVTVNKYASLCGDVVVLRPSTALRATTSKEGLSVDADEVLKSVTEKIDAIEDKPEAALKAGVAVVGVVVASGIVSSIDAIPLLPKLLELVGTGYSAWFTYRYLLKKDSRAELLADFEKIKADV